MKNIHVLPTDKPSVLYKRNDLKTYHLGDFNICNPDDKLRTNQNIYITSDEEIKEGDWCLDTLSDILFISDGNLILHCRTDKKIILTTDQDLIKEGVQAIDDEFLEWFVKNPSCEEVEVIPYLEDIINPLTNEKFPAVQHRHFDETKMIFKYHYKIINPKTTQEIIDEDFSGGLDLGQIIPKEKPKQETFEEAEEGAYKFYPEDDQWTERHVFKLGAKWQKERMYNDLVNLLNFVSKEYNIGNGIGWFYSHESIEEISSVEVLKKWFEQFKKDSQ